MKRILLIVLLENKYLRHGEIGSGGMWELVVKTINRQIGRMSLALGRDGMYASWR